MIAGAVVGSLALDRGDRWSDLDLTFAVADDVPIADVLEDWTGRIVNDLDALQLFDLHSGSTIYRVLLLPGCLQCDLSFTPASEFGAIGPGFQIVFGRAVHKPQARPPSAKELFGYAVHHAVRARICIERGRYWQAEYWVSGARDFALSLASRRRGLPARHGRGFDDLPADVHEALVPALVSSLDRHELLRALEAAVTGLLREADDVRELAAKTEPRLRELLADWIK
ncbi:MAG: nucleotidyltransferase domain-containing protein [Thermoanaerobaculia bacterium]